ncbi:hypothetical protein [Dyadobacter luticola]|uniref:Uncharacterized protein n=1 Tax=Dyadobacter luticola TaxID=1979387 RepID=A0A5R9L3Z6_9BACT|nr:hypothetical protein [Dyadobacter luticola]TLV03312.1 hypothetical protein FEN17_06785 [Dyadobacter luticola]
MKKLIVSAVALTLISFASVQAQTAQQDATQATQKEAKTTTQATSTQDPTTQEPVKTKSSKEEKVAVKTEELPDGIQKAIKGDQFSGWTVKKAYLVTEPGKDQYYELQVANGKENARVKLDKNGNNVG